MYLVQRQQTVTAVLVAVLVHDKRARRKIRCTHKDTIAANESRRSRSHRQNEIICTINRLFGKYTGLHNTIRQVNGAGLGIGCVVGRASGSIIDGIADPWSMTLAAAAPNAVKLIAVFQHLNGGVKSKCFRSSGCTQRLAGRTVAERSGTRIGHAELAVSGNLCIAQRTPDSSLRSRKIHICGKVAGVEHLGTADKGVQRVTAVRLDNNAVHTHILDLPGYGVRLAACTGISLGVICAVCADFRTVRCFGEHRPYITRCTILLEPRLADALVRHIVGFTDLDLNGRCLVIFFRSKCGRYTDRHAAAKRYRRQHACQGTLQEVFSHFFISFCK